MKPRGRSGLLFFQLSSLVFVDGLVSVNLVLDLVVLRLDRLLLSFQLGLFSVQAIVFLSELFELLFQLGVLVEQLLGLLLQVQHERILDLQVLLQFLFCSSKRG